MSAWRRFLLLCGLGGSDLFVPSARRVVFGAREVVDGELARVGRVRVVGRRAFDRTQDGRLVVVREW